MQQPKYRHRFIILCLLILLSLISPVTLAWGGHDDITAQILQALNDERLQSSALSQLQFTEYTYHQVDTQPYGPNFRLRQLEKGPVSATWILCNYASEPDWYMDADLSISSWQWATGGSHGWRHGFRKMWPMRFGVAPQRAQYFYDLAQVAYKKGDPYWAFRFLARSLHYIEDVGQPLHSLPIPMRDFVFTYTFNIKYASVAAANLHHAMENFIAYALRNKDSVLLDAMQTDNRVKVTNVIAATERLSGKNSKLAIQILRATARQWPQLVSRDEIRLTATDFASALESEAGKEIIELSAKALKETSAVVASVIMQFLDDVKAP